MKEFKGTIGPWEVIEHSWSDTSIYSGDTVIATKSIYEDATEETQDLLESEVSANFNLIASAPDLLNACMTVVSGYEGDGMEGMGPRDEVFYEYCKQAITKALGE